MATATSRSFSVRPSASGLIAAGALLALAAVAGVLALTGAFAGGSGTAGTDRAAGAGGSVPPGWHTVTTSSAETTLAYPPGWSAGHSDPGTASAYLDLSAADIPRGYLNVTPRQGNESLAGWVGFRLAHNREEGDKQVRRISSTSGLRVGAATANCLTDAYVAKVGSRQWRELACFVQGPHSASVFVGAAQPRDWAAVGPVVQRSLSALVQR